MRDWKLSHEDWIRNGGIVPKIPEVSLTTLRGLSLSDSPGTIETSDLKEFREHNLDIKNVDDAELLMIDARIQLAEPVVGRKGNYKPAGVNAEFEAIRMSMMATVTGSAKVTRLREPGPTNVYRLQIDRLPPGQHVELGVLTSLRPWEASDFSFDTPLWAGVNEHPVINYYIDGTFQFDYQGARLTKRFFAPIGYDKETRHQHLIEVIEGRGNWKPVVTELFN